MSSTSFNLDVIQIPQPCAARWNEMTGDERTRFCAHCQRHVHDLTAMTRADAVDLICGNAGELCVRFTRADNGAIKTLDYAPAARGSTLRRWLCISALLALAAGLGSYLWSRPKPQTPVFAGRIAMPMIQPAPPSGTQNP